MFGIEYVRKTTGRVQNDQKHKTWFHPLKWNHLRGGKKYFCPHNLWRELKSRHALFKKIKNFKKSFWLTRKTNLSTIGKHESYWSCPLLQLCSNFHNSSFHQGEDFLTKLLGNYHKMMAIIPVIGHFAVMVQTVKWHIGFKYFHRRWKVTSDKS